MWFLSPGLAGLKAGASGLKDEFPFSTAGVISPRPGIPGLFLKFGKVNPGFCDSTCRGRVGVALFVSELPGPNEGPATGKKNNTIRKFCR